MSLLPFPLRRGSTQMEESPEAELARLSPAQRKAIADVEATFRELEELRNLVAQLKSELHQSSIREHYLKEALADAEYKRDRFQLQASSMFNAVRYASLILTKTADEATNEIKANHPHREVVTEEQLADIANSLNLIPEQTDDASKA